MSIPVAVFPNQANILETLFSLYQIDTMSQYIDFLR